MFRNVLIGIAIIIEVPAAAMGVLNLVNNNYMVAAIALLIATAASFSHVTILEKIVREKEGLSCKASS